MEKIYFDSIGKYNEVYGLPTKHPLVATIDLNEASRYANNVEIIGDIYGLYLKNTPYCSLKYGRKTYDFQSGTVVSIAPGQRVEMSLSAEQISLDVKGIIFHPDFLFGTTLDEKIKDFSFSTILNWSLFIFPIKKGESFFSTIMQSERNLNIPSTNTLLM